MSISAVIDRLKKYDFLSDFLTDKALAQFKKYIVTGCTSFCLEYTIFYILYRYLGMWYILANTITYMVIFWFNFLANRLWSFQSKDNLKRQLTLYGILFAFNLAATNGLMYFLSDMVGVTPLISKILVMGAVVSWNFILYKKVIYR